MAHEVAVYPPSIQAINAKNHNFNVNNTNEPISVLDTRRSPSPSTSTSTFSGSATTKKWPESIPDWPELQPIPTNFEPQPKRSGLELDNWETMLPESGDHDSLLRWISGDVDDTPITLKQLLQGNQIDETPMPIPETQFRHSGFQKPPDFDPGHELLVKKQNEMLSLHQQKSIMAAKQEPHHQNQLIFDQIRASAELILSGNFSHAQAILARLNHHLPSTMPPIQRSGFYFKEALEMQIGFITTSNPRIVPTPSDGMFKMCAYKVLSEVSPVIQFMNFTSNQTIIEALDGADYDYVHIIDFDIGFGAQWASFIQELPRKKNGCSLKITAFASPSTHHAIELALMHENLSQFARETGVSFELEVVNFDSFDPDSFSVSGNEAVAVNFPIWSASTHLPAIPSLLRFIKRLSPRIVVSLDRGCERTDLPFPQYLLRGLEYYEVFLDSIDAANVPPFTANKIEKFLLQPQIERMVAGKLQFPEPMPHWKTLFTASGYLPVLFSNFAEAQADCVVKRSHIRGFHVEKRHSSLVLSWRNRQLVAASAWRC